MRPAASGQRPAASGQRPAASGMICARREVGARRPAPPTSAESPQRPEPHRARLSLLLPAFALLLGALSLFHATPAEAQLPTAPSVPQNVQVTPGDAELTIAWQAPSSWGDWTAAYFQLQWRGGGSTTIFGNIYEYGPNDFVGVRFSSGDYLEPTETSHVFTGIQTDGRDNYPVRNGNIYEFRIRAVSQQPGTDGSIDGHFVQGDWVTFSGTPGTVAAPTGLTVTPGNAKLDLTWTAPSGTLTGYDVHYSTASGIAPFQAVAGSNPANDWAAVTRSGTTTSQTISSLVNGTVYFVRVRATNAAGAGAWVFGTGKPGGPAVPTRLSVIPGNAKLDLIWTAPSGTLTGYDVHYTSSSAGVGAAASGSDPSAAWVAVTRSGTTASQTISSLINATTYRVRVRAKTSSASSAWVFGSGTPNGPVWEATITPVAYSQGGLAGVGCLTKAQCDSQISSNSFRVGGTDYHFILAVDVNSGASQLFQAQLNANPNSELRAYKFCVGTQEHSFSSLDSITSLTDPGWVGGTAVQLKIAFACTAQGTPNPTVTLSVDRTSVPAGESITLSATLSPTQLGWVTVNLGKQAGTAHSSKYNLASSIFIAAGQTRGTDITITTNTNIEALGTFRVFITGFQKQPTVGNLINGTPSSAPLTLTITESENADLAALSATQAGSAGGPYSALDIGAFAAATTAYTATVPPATTHVKLRLRGEDESSGYVVGTPNFPLASVQVSKDGTTAQKTSTIDLGGNLDFGPILLSVGENIINVRVTAQDGTTTKDYIITVTLQQIAAPASLTVAPGNAKLDLTWTAPTGTLTGYDVHYTSAVAGTVGNDVAVQTSGSATASTGWLAVTRSGTTASQTISSLANGTTYRVRVRAVNAAGGSAWAFGTGTPEALPTVSLSALPNPVDEGSTVTVTATLSQQLAAAVTIPVMLTAVSAEPGDYGTLTSISIAAGAMTGTGTISTSKDADTADDTFTVELGTLPSTLAAGTSSVVVTIAEPPGVSLRFAEPGRRGFLRDGDGDAGADAVCGRDDSADGDVRHRGVRRPRLADLHHGRRRRAHRLGHDRGEPGRRRRGRDLHGGAGRQPAGGGEPGQPGVGGDHDR